jgi:hypothetical protein
MAISYTAATDAADALLEFYVRGDAMSQTMQERPLLRVLTGAQETFPGGKQYISEPVQGVYMDTSASGFFAGYEHADTLTFSEGGNLDRCQVPWYEVHAGLEISWTDLKRDGITITESDEPSMHSKRDQVILTSLFANRMQDFTESWARSMNKMLWQDGSQDSKQVPGLLYMIPDDPTSGTFENIARTYTWWRNRALVSGNKITASASAQTLTKTLRSERVQLMRYGGRPNAALCGSDFIDALRLEVHEKGQYTQTGFKKSTDISMPYIELDGLRFEYDPTLDDLGLAKRCYVFDTRRLKLRPMEGEENRIIKPTRPYDQLVFLRSMTWTGGLLQTQPNSSGVYEVA